jgi:large subunit ribosomal protein L19
MNVRINKEEAKMDLIKAFTNEQLKENVPEIVVGNNVRVHIRIVEAAKGKDVKERIQIFEGTVIAKHGGGISETFTVRRVAYGCGVEKTFPLHSPNVVKVETTRVGKVRRAKLNYLRNRVGKSSKVKERI